MTSVRPLIAVFIFSVTVASAATASPVAVRFSTRVVTASGLSPGTEVLFFGDAKIPVTYFSRLKQWQFVAIAGADGSASVETEIDIPVNALWVIADLRTGQVTTATPRPLGVQTVDIGRSSMSSTADRFSFDRSFLDLLYVHAGEGAWIWHATDGGVGDEDGANGRVTVDITKAVHVAGAAAPKVFSPGGTLIAIDFVDLKVLTTDVQRLLPHVRP